MLGIVNRVAIDTETGTHETMNNRYPLKRKGADGGVITRLSTEAIPRIQILNSSYQELEREACTDFEAVVADRQMSI